MPALGASQDYMPVCTYVCISILISVHLHHCLEIINMARNCAQLMQPQAMESNTLGGAVYYLCLYVYPVIRGPFAIFVFVLILSVGVQWRDGLSPHCVSLYPSGV